MISIICDACLARFQLADEAAGTTVFCPKCGAKNGVPAAPGASPSPGPAIPASQTTTAAGETVLLHIRPAMFRARPASFTGLLLLGLGGVAAGVYFLTDSNSTLGIVCLVASLLG